MANFAIQIGIQVAVAVATSLISRLFAKDTVLPTAVGDRLQSLNVQASEYGSMIPIIYGRGRFAGNVIWARDIREVEIRETTSVSGGGGKGGGGSQSQTSIRYEYYATLAIAVCEGEIDEVTRVWADAGPITAEQLLESAGKYEVFLGTETQSPSTIIESYDGSGNVPAYRGTAYVVLEDFPLAKYGNRIPNFTFETKRRVAFGNDNVEEKIKAVTIIPGSGEFVYSTDITEKQNVAIASDSSTAIPTGTRIKMNMHNFDDVANATLALDQLEKALPNLEAVALVVNWFVTTIDVTNADIVPKVEFNSTEAQVIPFDWSVGSYTRATAQAVKEFPDGSLTYGGTPTDKSVINFCQAAQAKGWHVMLYPMPLVDTVDEDAGETDKPWRGRLVPVDTADVTAFFTGSEGYNNFIRHYSQLSVSGVHIKTVIDSFVIGSELIGLTTFDSGSNTYPAVTRLATLAGDVQSDLSGGSVSVGYAADWSEYHSIGGYYHLDELWTDANIDFVGIDAYFPITPDLEQSEITEDLIQQYWEDGEGYDYFYGNSEARTTDLPTNAFTTTTSSDQVSCNFPNHSNITVNGTVTFAGTTGNPGGITNANIDGTRIVVSITDANNFVFMAGGSASSTTSGGGSAITIDKPESFTGATYAWKNLENWWNSSHLHNGVTPTGWTAKLKPIWFTEFGFPSVDGAANQPNVFVDPTSSENYYPRGSKQRVDFRAQRQAINATLDYLSDRNGESGNGNLTPVNRCFCWTWDARPFPFFPDLLNVWADGVNWKTGHWINGKIGVSTLGAIVAEILTTVGYASSDYDVADLTDLVEGYILSERQTARDAIDKLQAAYFFDMVESNGQLKFVRRGKTSVVTITENDLVPLASEPIKVAIETVRKHELELPRRVDISYINRVSDYGSGTQTAQRWLANAQNQVSLNLPLVLSDIEAKQIADKSLYTSWIARNEYKFILPPKYAYLEPTDICTITVNGVSYVIRITAVEIGHYGLMRCSGVAEDISTYDFYIEPGSTTNTQQGGDTIPNSQVVLLDLPAYPAETDQLGSMRIAFSALGANWPGAILYRSDDGGVSGGNSFNQVTNTNSQAIIGQALNPLASGPTHVFDNANYLDVAILSGELSSVTELAVLNGANACVLGDEILQFQTATYLADGQYRLSKLLRGRLGTEYAVSGHAISDQFVFLDSSVIKEPVPTNFFGIEKYYKGVTSGQLITNINEQSFTYTGKKLKPYSPVDIQGSRDVSDNLTITWKRRTRVNGDWRDGVDIPLMEESEEYEIDIISGASVLRTLTSTTQTVDYDAADQTTDFGSAQSSIEINIYQMSAIVGRGYAGNATI